MRFSDNITEDILIDTEVGERTFTFQVQANLLIKFFGRGLGGKLDFVTFLHHCNRLPSFDEPTADSFFLVRRYHSEPAAEADAAIMAINDRKSYDRILIFCQQDGLQVLGDPVTEVGRRVRLRFKIFYNLGFIARELRFKRAVEDLAERIHIVVAKFFNTNLHEDIIIQDMKFKYSHVTVSGSFDHLHIGHQKIIDTAFQQSMKVSVGIADGPMLVGKQYQPGMELYELRSKAVKSYIEKKYPTHTVQFFKLTDIFGIALHDSTLDSIVVTRETYPNAVLINNKRRQKSFPKLKIIQADFVKDKSGKVIRATRIRQGEIDRKGNIYVSKFNKSHIAHLPGKMRALLRQPLGIIIPGTETDQDRTAERVVKIIKKMNPPFIITVGDVVSSRLKAKGLQIDLRIIDLHTQRGRIIYSEKGSVKVKNKVFVNKAGSLSFHVAKQTYILIKRGLTEKKTVKLVIRGEEDLIALPAILLAPLGSVVLYGQVGLGVVLTSVTEEMKEKVRSILDKFE